MGMTGVFWDTVPKGDVPSNNETSHRCGVCGLSLSPKNHVMWLLLCVASATVRNKGHGKLRGEGWNHLLMELLTIMCIAMETRLFWLCTISLSSGNPHFSGPAKPIMGLSSVLGSLANTEQQWDFSVSQESWSLSSVHSTGVIWATRILVLKCQEFDKHLVKNQKHVFSSSILLYAPKTFNSHQLNTWLKATLRFYTCVIWLVGDIYPNTHSLCFLWAVTEKRAR